jgi:hypothetical protein
MVDTPRNGDDSPVGLLVCLGAANANEKPFFDDLNIGNIQGD